MKRINININMKPFKTFIKNNYVVLLSFFLPVIIMHSAYMFRGVVPAGKSDVLIIDLYHQYAPFISDLRDKLVSFSSFLYSWTGGLGTNYLPQLAYYLSSPLNLLTVLFPKSYLSEAILFLVLLKVGMAGAFFAVYLKGVHKRQDLVTTAFSLLYALSGYMLAYNWNIMWLDVIYLFPLAVLGLVKLVRDGRGVLYSVTVALMLLTNFYAAFFACLFIALYYPACLSRYHTIRKPGVLVKKTALFTAFSLLSAGLSAVLLLPTYYALKITSAAGETIPGTLIHYFDFFDYISRHFVGSSPAIRDGMPNMYCGIVVLILLPIYFFSKQIRVKEKLWNIFLLIILVVSFNMNILNFIWHGFHFPNQLPYRFSFVYVFLVLSIAYRAFGSLKEFTGKQIGAVCTCVLAAVVLSQKLNDSRPEYYVLYASIAAVIIYAAVLTIDRCRVIHNRQKVLAFLLVVVMEVTANTMLGVWNIDMQESYSPHNGYSSGREVEDIRIQLDEIAGNDSGMFYRTEILPPKTTNDPHLYNFNGLSIFASTYPMKPVKTMQNLGYHSNGINSFKYEGSNILLDSLFGIKYLIHRNIKIEERLYRKINSTDEITVFENPYALPLGFYASSGIKDWRSSSSNPFNGQNRLLNKICGAGDVFIQLDQEPGAQSNLTFSSTWSKYYNYKRTNKKADSTARIKIIVKEDRQVYLYLDVRSNTVSSGHVMVKDNKITFNARRSTLVNLGFIEGDTPVELVLNFDESEDESGRFEVYSYGLDLPVFEEAVELIREKSFVMDSFSDTRIKGHIEADEDGLLVMSIPYDKGWKVKVDGQRAGTYPLDDGLLSVELKAGFHDIEMWFVPDRFKLGLGITLASFVILMLVILFYRRKHNKLNSISNGDLK